MGIFDSMNFNLEEDYKAEPLIPAGAKVNGTLTGVKISEAKYCMIFEVCLNNNDEMVKADGETPVDGTHLLKKVWLPKPGDDKIMTPSGSGTKWQWKVNNLAETLRGLGINATTPEEILTGVENQEWIDRDVVCTVGVNEYRGRITNEINEIVTDIEEPF